MRTRQSAKDIILFFAVLFILPIWQISFAQEEPKTDEYKIVIKDHQFSPEPLVIPADQKIKLIVENQDPTVEEFESYDLNREKVVAGRGKIILFVGPLKSGTYKYFGEFHRDTARGEIIAE